MKTQLTALLFTLVMNGFSQSWSVAGMGTTTNMYRNASWVGSGHSGTNHTVQVYISTSGDFNATDVYIYYAGKKYYNNSTLTFNPGNYAFQTCWSTPSTALCGGTCIVSIKFWESGIGYLYQGSGVINIVTPTLSGNTNFCSGSQNSFTLDLPGGNTTSTVTISKPGWLINGQASPTNVTGNQFTISPPAYADSPILTISGDNYCSSIQNNLVHSYVIPNNPTNLTFTAVNDCFYQVNTTSVNNGFYYEWADNSNFTDFDQTTRPFTRSASGNDFMQGSSLRVWVRARNGCGLSTNSYNRMLYFPANSNCLKVLKSTQVDINNEEADLLPVVDISISLNASNNTLHIELPSGSNTAIIQCYSSEGNLVGNFKVNSNISNISLPLSIMHNFMIVNVLSDGRHFSKKIAT